MIASTILVCSAFAGYSSRMGHRISRQRQALRTSHSIRPIPQVTLPVSSPCIAAGRPVGACESNRMMPVAAGYSLPDRVPGDNRTGRSDGDPVVPCAHERTAASGRVHRRTQFPPFGRRGRRSLRGGRPPANDSCDPEILWSRRSRIPEGRDDLRQPLFDYARVHRPPHCDDFIEKKPSERTRTDRPDAPGRRRTQSDVAHEPVR